MEITSPGADANSIWYVTNGLLVVELITGQMQEGHAKFTPRGSANVNVAGDSDDASGPTYESFSSLLNAPAKSVGSVINERVIRSGAVSSESGLTGYGVTVARVDDVTNHAIASPFWEFMNSWGTVYQNGEYVTSQLFENPYFATGRPITEAYWANVKVAGTYQDVLMQCFERRCLTFNPQNTPQWQVEAGNVGQHYYQWRYGSVAPPPPPAGPAPSPTLSPSELRYVESVLTITNDTLTSVDQFIYLISDPDLLSPYWLGLFLLEMDEWRDLAYRLYALTPPAKFVEAHDDFKIGYAALSLAADYMEDGVWYLNADDFETGLDFYFIAMAYITDGLEKITAILE